MGGTWRYWVTGGIAAVLAAASQADPEDREQRASRSSAYSVEETVDRLQQQARLKGLPIFATLYAPHAASRDGVALLLVLGNDSAHTAVLQSTHHGALALPLTMRVAPRQGGGSEVQFSAPHWLADQPDLPQELLAKVRALPALVDAALVVGPTA